MKELSSYVFSPLREGDIALYRGSGNGLAPILLDAQIYSCLIIPARLTIRDRPYFRRSKGEFGAHMQ